MAQYDEYYNARNVIDEILQKDFIGPVKDDEILVELPTQYYIMGKLYPQSDENEILDLARNPILESESDVYDASLALSNVRNPSSMGITFTLKTGVTRFVVNGYFSWYGMIPFEAAEARGIDVSRWRDASDNKRPKEFWKRHSEKFDIPIELNFQKNPLTYELIHGIQLYVYINRKFSTGESVVTVTLINVNNASKDLADIAQKSVFQASVKVTSDRKVKLPIFTTVGRQIDLGIDPEIQELDMLYRDNHYYAQGHGCSVEWDTENTEPLWITSEFFPSFNLLQMKAASFNDLPIFGMKYLKEADSADIISGLTTFMQRYEQWITKVNGEAAAFTGKDAKAAERNIQKCRDALNQIRETIHQLEISLAGNKVVWKAFQMANEAMLLQRVQTLKRNGKSVNERQISWYPFQLAFIMHEMISFINPDLQARKIVDLLWFPTGGGKTEAYLGIAAFVIFLRRLRNKNDDGVTVIMRYTLRLLTIQQFERASILIFACELLRRKYSLGGQEISIGLWVGGKLTPNTLVEARVSINKQKSGEIPGDDDANPCQIQVCPWCGTKIKPEDYEVNIDEKKMIIHCSNIGCDIHDMPSGMPMHIIDEAMYKHLPSFVVATIDKFAQLPLSDKPAALLGISNGRKSPELIIQDELHLISGPLGTMTGIYEAAITKLCEQNDIPTKVIASTATIRNAENQIKALYGRNYTQFPPQGISINDSFFAEISRETDRPARKYFGVMGIGATATTTLIRVNATLLFGTRYLEALGYNEKVIDNFWTITGYFNSLRELGGASTQIMDDVQSRFNYLCDTKFASVYPGMPKKIRHDNIEELTSRMSNTDITRVIQVGLKKPYTKGNAFDAYSFILASNMISVGVDVGRLGTMVVAGQPKNNAEYIQATSRVGRDNPGLVITVYNASRSRDRSHYEQFLRYHSALYRYVEATSLTPFSDRARDRGLHALFVALCRNMIDNLRKDNEAINFRADNPEVEKVEKLIYEYVSIVDQEELNCVKEELETIKQEWQDKAIGTLNYHKYYGDKNLLKPDTDEDRFRTMNSMRNVDGQAGIFLLGR